MASSLPVSTASQRPLLWLCTGDDETSAQLLAARHTQEVSEPFHPILQTARSEIVETCRSRDHSALIEGDREGLALAVEAASEDEIGRIARELGSILMDDGDYWRGLPLAAESVLGVQLAPQPPELEAIESDAPLGPRSRESGLAQDGAEIEP
jgi:hypothetical protein